MNQQVYDVLIIGAGAAGIAAGRRLQDAGKEVLLVEARHRVGGRIHTDHDFADYPIELGAEYIHGDQAVIHDLLKPAGLSSIPVVRFKNIRWSENASKALPMAQHSLSLKEKMDRVMDDFYALETANLPTDLSLAEYMRQCGWDEWGLRCIDVLVGQPFCINIESVSCYDLAREMQADHAGDDESRIGEGYGALMDWYSRGLAIQLGTPVNSIQWGSDGVTVNQTLRAKTCIITIPVNLLQQGAINFDPVLPASKQHAIQQFRMEPATKLLYRFREQLWDDELTLMAHTGAIARWWTPGYHRSSNTPILCGFLTADRAKNIDAMEETVALQTGLCDISKLLGIPIEKLSAACETSKRVSWAKDVYTQGGYAYLPPGAAESRLVLARSESKVLFFAGEATAYYTNPQTVHGAIESGWHVADEILATL